MSDFLDENSSQDFWYDIASDKAEKFLSDFSQKDWEELNENLPYLELELKRKLAYCLNESGNHYQLKTLILLTDTKDNELFEICIDSLRDFINKESAKSIAKSPYIIERIKKMIPTSGKPTRIVFKDLLTKISNFTGDSSILFDDNNF